jgi:predicted acyl esterase
VTSADDDSDSPPSATRRPTHPLGFLLAVPLCLALAPGGAGVVRAAEAPQSAEAAQADVVITRDVMVAMRDGVHLATDLYRPGRAGAARGSPFPAILLRTPYSKEVRAPSFASYFAARGYVVVVQDVRGRYKSEGRWRPIYDDGRDGYDTAAWIGRQQWFHGGIGTVGTSYEGGTQHVLALAGAPHLKAMVPLFSVSDVGRYGIRHNGAFELRWFNWVFSMGDPGGEPNLTAAARAASDPATPPRSQSWCATCRSTCARCRCAQGRRRSSSRPTTRAG